MVVLTDSNAEKRPPRNKMISVVERHQREKSMKPETVSQKPRVADNVLLAESCPSK